VGKVVTGDIGMSVECFQMVVESGTEVRKLKLAMGKEVRVVWHFLYSNWPDMTAPTKENQGEILSLIKMTRFKIDRVQVGEDKPDTNARLVHCSAGVGRTGTFIALDHLLQDVEEWKKKGTTVDDPVFECVKRLREQRMKMVYKKEQFASIYQILADQWDM